MKLIICTSYTKKIEKGKKLSLNLNILVDPQFPLQFEENWIRMKIKLIQLKSGIRIRIFSDAPHWFKQKTCLHVLYQNVIVLFDVFMAIFCKKPTVGVDSNLIPVINSAPDGSGSPFQIF